MHTLIKRKKYLEDPEIQKIPQPEATKTLQENDYSDISRHWDGIFSFAKFKHNPKNPFPQPEIEEALKWLSKDCGSILDFGFGSGAVPIRCAELGISRILGVDISEKAVSIARKSAEENGVSERCEFIPGDHSKLKKFEENSFDGAVLFNVLDNMYPEDSSMVIRELHRILISNGKLLVKLNARMSRTTFDNEGFKKISKDFYMESSGLVFWNLSDEEFSNLMSKKFEIERKSNVEYEKNISNRIFYARNSPI